MIWPSWPLSVRLRRAGPAHKMGIQELLDKGLRDRARGAPDYMVGQRLAQLRTMGLNGDDIQKRIGEFKVCAGQPRLLLHRQAQRCPFLEKRCARKLQRGCCCDWSWNPSGSLSLL